MTRWQRELLQLIAVDRAFGLAFFYSFFENLAMKKIWRSSCTENLAIWLYRESEHQDYVRRKIKEYMM